MSPSVSSPLAPVLSPGRFMAEEVGNFDSLDTNFVIYMTWYLHWCGMPKLPWVGNLWNEFIEALCSHFLCKLFFPLPCFVIPRRFLEVLLPVICVWFDEFVL
jgi:hypothetical protein